MNCFYYTTGEFAPDDDIWAQGEFHGYRLIHGTAPGFTNNTV